LVRGERVLLSWTGTIFEYLMPTLWMRHYPATITEQSAKAAVRIQRDFARRRGVPWGISESACLGNGAGDPGYEAFGVPDIAIKRMLEAVVISPYSSFLALASDPAPAVENLRQLEQYGWTGRYGFYESIEYTRNGGQPIRQWMAHHQGMSLLAITNLLFDNIMQQYFHAEPQVLATELLLHERMSVTAYTEPDVLPAPEPLPVAVAEAAT
ncbi:MAG TPA: glucoamylase family protein, partial [Bryobacteraceae bacterium]|nr:glucoamylase family protein [Bryobacteraceae bacterium]